MIELIIFKERKVFMERKVISETELIEWMNRELHKVEDYKGCKFTSVHRLEDEDDVGCNWSDPNVRCSGTTATVCEERAKRIFSKAREMFNVE
jgi:hypothetical protein